jgi:cyclophilin family peptidyl-prolyl cis-trans isomerase
MYRILVYLFFWIFVMSCGTPKAVFSSTASESSAPTTISFHNTSLKATQYWWDFGDGNTSTEKSPKHVYMNSGRYQVSLKVSDGSKTSFVNNDLFVNPPEKCLIALETSAGTMIVHLFDATPFHRDNFLKLIEEQYYNNLLFHRVIKGFMVQSGDPNSKNAPKGKELGTGGPLYNIKNEISDTLFHVKGALAAARTPDEVNPKKESSGSQFYIVHGKSVTESQLEKNELEKNFRYSEEARKKYIQNGGFPDLDMNYTVFGQVISGIEVIDKIASSETDKRDRPLSDIKILNIQVIK